MELQDVSVKTLVRMDDKTLGECQRGLTIHVGTKTEKAARLVNRMIIDEKARRSVFL